MEQEVRGVVKRTISHWTAKTKRHVGMETLNATWAPMYPFQVEERREQEFPGGRVTGGEEDGKWKFGLGEREIGDKLAERRLKSQGFPMRKVHFIKGIVQKTMPGELQRHGSGLRRALGLEERGEERVGSKKSPHDGGLSILRLDTDWYDSTRTELRTLFKYLNPGGLLVVDDYCYWSGSRRATNEFLFGKKNYEHDSAWLKYAFYKAGAAKMPRPVSESLSGLKENNSFNEEKTNPFTDDEEIPNLRYLDILDYHGRSCFLARKREPDNPLSNEEFFRLREDMMMEDFVFGHFVRERARECWKWYSLEDENIRKAGFTVWGFENWLTELREGRVALPYEEAWGPAPFTSTLKRHEKEPREKENKIANRNADAYRDTLETELLRRAAVQDIKQEKRQQQQRQQQHQKQLSDKNNSDGQNTMLDETSDEKMSGTSGEPVGYGGLSRYDLSIRRGAEFIFKKSELQDLGKASYAEEERLREEFSSGRIRVED